MPITTTAAWLTNNNMNTKHILGYLLLLLLAACRPSEADMRQIRFWADPNALLWPDYADVTVPVNIAPLNCYVVPPHTGYTLKAYGTSADTLRLKGRHRIKFKESAWHRLLQQNQGGRIWFDLHLKNADTVADHRFFIDVRDSIDPYMVCRLIEPCYQTAFYLQTIEYNLGRATQRTLFDNRLQTSGCQNCHTFAQNNGNYFMYHVRFNRTGTFIVRHDTVLRVDLKSARFPQGGVYPAWHPDKNLIAFGTALACPYVYSTDIQRRTEVFDSMGDIIVYDINRNRIFTDHRISGTDTEETFPCWSPDGQYLYLCQSAKPLHDSAETEMAYFQKIRYNLIRIAFCQESQTFGAIDTLVDAALTQQTVSFPRISPDGRFLVFCLSHHGTFPIRHPESDLYLIDLQYPEHAPDSGWRAAARGYAMKKMENINSPYSESYHAWSGNSRWLVFSSKRKDHFYARPYFTYVDSTGASAKPFLLPQRDPVYYLTLMQSYNVPELARTPAATSAARSLEASRMPQITVDTILIR